MEGDTLARAGYRVETRDTDLVIEKNGTGLRQICFHEEILKYDYEQFDEAESLSLYIRNKRVLQFLYCEN